MTAADVSHGAGDDLFVVIHPLAQPCNALIPSGGSFHWHLPLGNDLARDDPDSKPSFWPRAVEPSGRQPTGRTAGGLDGGCVSRDLLLPPPPMEGLTAAPPPRIPETTSLLKPLAHLPLF